MRVDLCLNPKMFTRKEVLDKIPHIQEILSKNGVLLAYLFGSILMDDLKPLGDLDIAILPDPCKYHWLNTYSEIHGDLCRLFGADNIDILMLNEASPQFRMSVIKSGRPILFKDENVVTEFIDETIFHYFDTNHLRLEHWHYLHQNIREGIIKAMRRLNKERVNLFLDRIEEAVLHLEKMAKSLEKAEFLQQDSTKRALVEHYLRIAIEATLDIGRHIIAVKGLAIPDEYKKIGRILAENGVVPYEMGEKIVSLAGLRNILVHLYWQIDYEKIYEIITQEIHFFERYAQIILTYMEKEG